MASAKPKNTNPNAVPTMPAECSLSIGSNKFVWMSLAIFPRMLNPTPVVASARTLNQNNWARCGAGEGDGLGSILILMARWLNVPAIKPGPAPQVNENDERIWGSRRPDENEGRCGCFCENRRFFKHGKLLIPRPRSIFLRLDAECFLCKT